MFSASRALLSCTTTFLNSFSSFACACFGVLPALRNAPYAAITFQRAPPEVNGFGVITWTPGFSRSSHVRIFFGLPSRTMKTTTESVTIPLNDCLFHFASTRPALTS